MNATMLCGLLNDLKDGLGVEDVRVRYGLSYERVAAVLYGRPEFHRHRAIALRYAGVGAVGEGGAG